MAVKLINIGQGTIISANRIIAIISPESAPVKRIIQDAKTTKKIIDATYGKRTRSVIIMDSDHVILSAIQPETVANKVNGDIKKIKTAKIKDILDIQNNTTSESKGNDDEN